MKLSREDFRNSIFERDNYKCIFCDNKAKDAHHILERKLWNKDENFGYFLDNGASVCEFHHIQCEATLISVEEVRRKASIKNVTIPKHLDSNKTYDKWGNEILSNGFRRKGELFEDEGVQKILKRYGMIGYFMED